MKISGSASFTRTALRLRSASLRDPVTVPPSLARSVSVVRVITVCTADLPKSLCNSSAMCRFMCFSTTPDLPTAPPSGPPCPASMATTRPLTASRAGDMTSTAVPPRRSASVLTSVSSAINARVLSRARKTM